MPYLYVEPSVYLEHQDVLVFETYDAGTNEPCKYWFTLEPEAADDGGGDRQFDVRSFVGEWPGTPTVRQWEDWWKPRFRLEHEAIAALLEKAIDEGKIKAP